LEDQKLSHFNPLALVSLSSESSIAETAKHFYGLEKKSFLILSENQFITMTGTVQN